MFDWGIFFLNKVKRWQKTYFIPFTVINKNYLEKVHNVRDLAHKNAAHVLNAARALLASPLPHTSPHGSRAGLEGCADGVGIEEGGVHGQADDNPVGADDRLADGRVPGRRTEGLIQHNGLKGQAFFGLQPLCQLG